MIQFSCRCGYAFSVSDDLAGGLIQCPQCKRLNDVPLLGELPGLDNQGMYKLDDPAPPRSDNPDRIAELTTIFTRDHFDIEGNPIDLRGSFADDRKGPVPVEALGPLDKAPPRYDPITGELIRDIDLKPEARPDSAALPVARKVLTLPTQIDGIDIPKPGESWLIPGRLFRPVNLLVICFILLAHAFAALMMAAIAAFYWILVPFWAMLHAMILAHYGNVIDDTGPTSKTDLPTPLRNLEWHEDTFGPLVRVMAALAVCYAPGIFLLFNATTVPPRLLLPLSAALVVAGTIFLPAALLATVTSGSLLNLRPDRLVGVIYVCGIEYAAALATWAMAAPLWIVGVVATNWLGAALIHPDIHPPDWLTFPLAAGALIAATFLLHLFCCHLGLLYRKHHAAFPWVYQRYTGQRKKNMAMGFPVQRPGKGRTPPKNQLRPSSLDGTGSPNDQIPMTNK